MADRVLTGVPGSEVPEASGVLDGPRPEDMPSTLAWDLVDVVDDLRTLNAEFGIRPYRVFLVHAVWSGNRRGEGQQRVTSRREILPVPLVRDLDSLRRNAHSTGVTEEGDVVVSEISPRIPEDDLMGLTPDLQSLEVQRTSKSNVEFWWEITENRPSGPKPRIRRLVPVAAPTLSRDAMEWRMTLTRQDYDRGRRGGLERTDF